MTVGVHTVTVLTDDPRRSVIDDITCLVDEVSIVHGRSDTTSQPDAAACTIDITVGPGAPLPINVDIGAAVHVDTTIGGVTHRRFTGRITDIDLGWDDAGPNTPDAGVGRIIAVSALADYTRRVVGSVAYPQELDGARVARVFAEAGLTLDYSDPGRRQVVAREADPEDALGVAQGAASSAGGLVWETTGGSIRYADIEHRRGASYGLVLDACDILVTPTWNRTTSGLVNAITMQYGAAPEGGSVPVVSLVNDPSQDKWGVYGYSVTTELATASDANSAAGLILAQNAGPVWMLASLPVDVEGLSEADTVTLLTLQVHSLLGLAGLPVIRSTPIDMGAWVEGWAETLAWGRHEVELVVSDFCRTAPPPRWDDEPPTLTWDMLDPGRIWDDEACWGPPPIAAAESAVKAPARAERGKVVSR